MCIPNGNGVPGELMDLNWLQNRINGLDNGCYSAREMFSDSWILFKRQRYYGKWFRQMVEHGCLEGIVVYRKRSDNSLEYKIA